MFHFDTNILKSCNQNNMYVNIESVYYYAYLPPTWQIVCLNKVMDLIRYVLGKNTNILKIKTKLNIYLF